MLRLFTLGELRLETEDGQPLSRRRKPLILLAYLARHAPRRLARAELATLLWGERSEAKARQSLRQALLELHRALGDQLLIAHDSVQLAAGGVELDAACFERDVDAGRNGEAVARWTTDFLDGDDDRAESALRSWIESERAGLRRRLTIACERLLDDAEQRGAKCEAIAIARRWMELSPLDENTCRRLVLALRRDGRAMEALASHSRFVARLREELELVPSREFLRLGRSLDEAARAERTRDVGAASRAALLPFVGRQVAFAALTGAWRNRVSRGDPLVIVEAPRGMGATRLCDELVRWLRDADPSALVLSCGGEVFADSPHVWRGARALFAPLQSAPALGGLSAESLADLAFLVPGLHQRFANLAVEHVPTAERLAASLAEALGAAAEDGPVIVVADRPVMEDDDSRRLIAQAATLARGDLLFVVVAEDHGAGPARAEQRVAGRVVTRLAALSIFDVCTLLDGASRLAGTDRDVLAAMLHRDTEGMPAYLGPCIEHLVDERLLAPGGATGASALSALDRGGLPVPARVRTWLRERLDELDADAARAAEAAAVLEGPCSTDDIGQVAGLAADERTHALESLERARLLRPQDRPWTYAFSPPMAQRGVYALIPRLRREMLHACAEAALASLPRARRTHGTRERVQYHHDRAGGAASPRRRIGARAFAAAIVVLLLVIGVSLRRLAIREAPRSQSVAIFPFAISGGARLDFLRAGMTDLLSTSLDGAAGLHTIDPRVVIAAAGGAAPELLTPARARDVASRLGASHFVLGTVVGAGGRLQASAILYETRGGEQPVARASAEGGEGNLFDLVDRLTALLAVGQGAGSGERLTRLAAATTSSLEALKAYLQARSEYRANDLFAAMASYQRAVAADSSFALAWYGLASTASWMMRPAIERAAVAQAVRQSERLSPRERTLIEGFAAFSRGSADTAERLAISLTQSYDDIEAWVLLGEVLYHHNWKRGRSLVESRHAWERVLALDSTYWPALQHLAEVAAIDGRAADADSLLGRYERSVGTAHTLLASRAMRAFAYGDSASRAAVVPQLARDRGFWLTLSVWYVSVLGRDVDAGRVLARHLVDAWRPPEQRGFGRVLLAHLALARGRWREARAELEVGRGQTPVDALEYELLLQLAPFRVADTADVSRTMEALERTSSHAVDASATMSWTHTQGSLRPLTRAYLTGLVAAERGDDATRARAIAALTSLPDPTASTAIARGFAFSVRAERERVHGHPAAALLLLERAARPTPFVAAWTSGFVSQARERYLRAELLHGLGRDDEALRWYGTFAENSPYDLVYLAPSLYRQGQIHDARGEGRLAAERYGRFLTLWKDCDPELRPMTDSARRRVEEIGRR